MLVKQLAALSATLLVASTTLAEGSALGASVQPLKGRLALQHAWGGLVGDGERFATAMLDERRSAVYDDARGTFSRRAVGCRLGPPYSSYAIAVCGDQQRVMNLATLGRGAIHGLRPEDRLGAFAGRRWVEAGTLDRTGSLVPLLLDWRTGQRRTTSSAGSVFDLDHAPLTPRPLLDGDTLTGVADSRSATIGSIRRLRLRHGGKVIALRRRCSGDGCQAVQLGAGIVTWWERDRACAYVVATRRSGCWRPPVPAFRGAGVSHTAHRMLIDVAPPESTDPPAGEHRSYVVPLRPLLRRGG